MDIFKNNKEKVKYSEEELKEAYDYIQSLKNYDYVDYCGGEMWKPHRSFKDFKLTYKDLKIKKKEFEELKHTMESVWHFCDTIFLGDNAEEDDIHVLDYCFHGERINWKAGDEYWLVFNFAFKRFEIRKADPKKWTPLEKMYVNNDLELRFKLGYIIEDDDKLRLDNESYKDKNVRYKFVKEFGVNSFPDRIEIHINGLNDEDNELTNYYQILDYYMHFSSFCKDGCNEELFDIISDFHFQEYLALEKLNNSFKFKWRTYNLYDKNEKEDMQKVYDTFLKYSHQLKFYQAHQKRKKNKK